MECIDLDGIILQKASLLAALSKESTPKNRMREALKEAIRQALKLASENATYKTEAIDPTKNCNLSTTNLRILVDKQSILDIEKLIV